jgi:adenylate cyclase
MWHRQEWWNWLVPVGVVLPAALVWSLTAHYLLEARRRAEIRRAFAHYLSPHMADQIAKQEFDLKPGGRLVEATMLFSDLKGFSSLSEELDDPKRISEVLIAYFNIMSGHVLQTGGTVIKYIGDAVFAAWGVPLADPDHAGRAVKAALEMMASSRMDVDGRPLVTRIGLNTGPALAGNLGSDFRFDYTLIGDAVNLAARLEGMNKYLGTTVLLSETTWRKVEGRFAARCVGSFRVVGKKGAVEVYELLGPAGPSAEEAAMVTFAKGLEAYRRGDLPAARELFEHARTERGWNDGPSDFYLARIDHWERVGKPESWDGTINLDEK